MGSDVTVLWETQTVFGKDYKVDIVCNKDKSVYTRGVSTLMKGSFFCQECANERYRNKLNSFNFNFIGLEKTKHDASSMVVFECRCCNSIRKLSVGNILVMKTIKCHECRIDLLHKILLDKGCQYVSKAHAENGLARITYRDVDGNDRVVSETNVLKGNFSPSSSHWNQKHSIYVFSSTDQDFKFIKIGTANNPEKRLKELKLTFDCEIISYQFKSRYLADAFESILHRKFSKFSINKSIAESFTNGLSRKLKNGVRIKHGCTEWFSSDCENEVIMEIELLKQSN